MVGVVAKVVAQLRMRRLIDPVSPVARKGWQNIRCIQ
jgi:hypothetical protein